MLLKDCRNLRVGLELRDNCNNGRRGVIVGIDVVPEWGSIYARAPDSIVVDWEDGGKSWIPIKSPTSVYVMENIECVRSEDE